jgi:hypothetical protein
VPVRALFWAVRAVLAETFRAMFDTIWFALSLPSPTFPSVTFTGTFALPTFWPAFALESVAVQCF